MARADAPQYSLAATAAWSRQTPAAPVSDRLSPPRGADADDLRELRSRVSLGEHVNEGLAHRVTRQEEESAGLRREIAELKAMCRELAFRSDLPRRSDEQLSEAGSNDGALLAQQQQINALQDRVSTSEPLLSSLSTRVAELGELPSSVFGLEVRIRAETSKIEELSRAVTELRDESRVARVSSMGAEPPAPAPSTVHLSAPTPAAAPASDPAPTAHADTVGAHILRQAEAKAAAAALSATAAEARAAAAEATVTELRERVERLEKDASEMAVSGGGWDRTIPQDSDEDPVLARIAALERRVGSVGAAAAEQSAEAVSALQEELRAVVTAVAEAKQRQADTDERVSRMGSGPADAASDSKIHDVVFREVAALEARVREVAKTMAPPQGPGDSVDPMGTEQRLTVGLTRRAEEHKLLRQSLANAAAMDAVGTVSPEAGLASAVSALRTRADASDAALSALSSQLHQSTSEVAAELTRIASVHCGALRDSTAVRQALLALSARVEAQAAAARSAEGLAGRLSRWESQQAAVATEIQGLCTAVSEMQTGASSSRALVQRVDVADRNAGATRAAVTELADQWRAEALLSRENLTATATRLAAVEKRCREIDAELGSHGRAVAVAAAAASERKGSASSAELRQHVAAAIAEVRKGLDDRESTMRRSQGELEARLESLVRQQVKRLAELALRADGEAAEGLKSQFDSKIEQVVRRSDGFSAQIDTCAEGLGASNVAISRLSDRVDAADALIARLAESLRCRTSYSPPPPLSDAERARGVAVAALFNR
eukprot:TRINITY_DN623_c0_g1_i2.p1 TRINITY_DN623_c0_g1~~TRINITY_DN623_c0_g1_i2.p1  ORF type:complete len:798 (+),score=285.47 TRINITY_DN623_c0_g1_i2:54-2396(+)